MDVLRNNIEIYLSPLGQDAAQDTCVLHLPFFDLSMVLQVSGENKSKVRTQLYRWVKSGKIEPLRREMYTLADTYRKAVLYPAVIANELYRPSYLSGLWALSYYGIIPEKVVFYTSVTPRVPRDFTNKWDKHLIARLNKIDQKKLVKDIEPFLEEPKEINLITKENIKKSIMLFYNG